MMSNTRQPRGRARRYELCTLLAIGASMTALGQQVPQAQVPGGGQLLQQLTPPPSSPPTNAPALSIQQTDLTPPDSTQLIAVTQIRVTGNKLLPTDRLHALVASAEGKALTLAQLQVLAGKITQYYRAHGYALARAYIPAQTIQNGEVSFAVLEARYGEVTLNNTSTTSDRPLRDTLTSLQAGEPVQENTLDRSLLLLSDIPGVIVNSTVRPGAQTGTSDLLVDVTSGPRYTGLVAIDDFGNRYTGRARGTISGNINSLLHEGDKLDVQALTSGSGMAYGQVGYHYLLNGQGTTLSAAASYLHYQLSGALSDLEAHGTAQVDSVTLNQPIFRSPMGNLYVQLQFDHKELHDAIDLADIRTDRHINGGTAVLAGDRRDNYGITNFNLSVAVGRVTFEDEGARLSDQLGAQTEGTGLHYDLTLARLQQITEANSVYLALTGQAASRNLDPADQFYLGGPSNARGYDVGAVTGSEGYLASAELRHNFGTHLNGTWVSSVFVDRGRIEVYRDPFAAGINVGDLTDAGVGLQWAGPNQWTASVQIGARVGPLAPLLHEDPGTRAWVQIQKGL